MLCGVSVFLFRDNQGGLCYNQVMKLEVVQKILELNRRFYAEFGPQFSATRQRIQPGVRKILTRIPKTGRVLDLGCGNGEFASELAQSQFEGTYLGVDFSLPLLADAMVQAEKLSATFREVNLAGPDWEKSLETGYFNVVTAFAVLHHIPDANLRLSILQKIRSLLAPKGEFILSNWQFLNSDRLKNRIQSWETVGLTNDDVEAGDYILDWRSGGTGLRYVHHFSDTELNKLAAEAGFKVKESFLSDGENGRLGLYQVWERDENQR